MYYIPSSMMSVNIQQLEWDTHNIGHIARHDVIPSEVEEVCENEVALRDGRNDYLILIGKTHAGRMLKIVLEQKAQSIWRVATAHDASRKERRYYQVEIGGEKTA
jgi:uncharacterized protein